MVRNSKHELDNRVLTKLFDLFFEVVGKKNSKNDFQKTIYDLLSPAERIMLAKRIAIIYLLMKKIDYITICDVLKVSSSTVAKFNIIMEKSMGVVPTFKFMLKNEKIVDFLEEILGVLFAPGNLGINWKNAWQYKKERERSKREGI